MTNEYQVVELRTYNVIPGKIDGLLKRFTTYHKPLFEKIGIGVQGPWLRELAPGYQMVYLLEFTSSGDRERLWEAYRSDPDLAAIRAIYSDSGPQVATIDSVILYSKDPGRGR